MKNNSYLRKYNCKTLTTIIYYYQENGRKMEGPKKNTSLPSEEMRWKQFYSKGYEEILTQNFPKETLWKFIERGILNDHNRHDALIYFGRHVSRSQFIEQVHLWGRVIKGMGIREGDELLIFGPTLPEFVYIMLAANMVGAVTILPNLMQTPEVLETMVSKSRVAFVFDGMENSLTNILAWEQFEHVVLISATRSMGYPLKLLAAPLNYLKHYKNSHRPKYMSADEAISRFGNYEGPLEAPTVTGKTSYVFCSSGTSGQGHAHQIGMSNDAMISMFQDALAFNLTGNPFREGTSAYCMLPPFVCTGYFVLVLAPLFRGMTVYIDPRLTHKQFTKNILTMRPQVTLIPGHYWVRFFLHVEELIKAGKRPDLSFFRFPVMGGEGCTPEALRRINNLMRECGSPVALTSGYGLTETFSVSTLDYQLDIFDKDYSKRAVSVGYAFPGVTVGIFDEQGHELGYGQRGQICVKTPALASNYYNEPESDTVVFGGEWFHTKDYGELDERGMLFVYGRYSQHIVSPDGQKVFFFDIANELRQDPAVKDALACTLVVAQDKTPLVAHVILEDDNTEPGEQIIIRLDERIKKILPHGVKIEGYHLERGLLRSNLVGKTDRDYYRNQLTGYRLYENGQLQEISFTKNINLQLK